MYDYSESLVRYRELRNLSHAACFRACQSSEEYQHAREGAGRGTDQDRGAMREGTGLGACEGLVPCRPAESEVSLGSAYRANILFFWIGGFRSIRLTKHGNGL